MKKSCWGSRSGPEELQGSKTQSFVDAGGRCFAASLKMDEYIYMCAEAGARQTSSDASARHLGMNQDDKSYNYSHALQRATAAGFLGWNNRIID